MATQKHILNQANRELQRIEEGLQQRRETLTRIKAEIVSMESRKAELEKTVRSIETEELIAEITKLLLKGKIPPSEVHDMIESAKQASKKADRKVSQETEEQNV